MHDSESQNQPQTHDQPVFVRRAEDGGVVLRVPANIARRGIRVEVLDGEVLDEELPRSDGAIAPTPALEPVAITNGSPLSLVLKESEGLLTNVDRVVFALHFLQREGRPAFSTGEVAAALKAAGQPDVRRLGPSYGQAAGQGLIEWGDGGYRVTPRGSAWAEGWTGPLTADGPGDRSP